MVLVLVVITGDVLYRFLATYNEISYLLYLLLSSSILNCCSMYLKKKSIYSMGAFGSSDEINK